MIPTVSALPLCRCVLRPGVDGVSVLTTPERRRRGSKGDFATKPSVPGQTQARVSHLQVTFVLSSTREHRERNEVMSCFSALDREQRT